MLITPGAESRVKLNGNAIHLHWVAAMGIARLFCGGLRRVLYTNGIFQVRHVFYCHTFHFPCLNTLKIKEEIEN